MLHHSNNYGNTADTYKSSDMTRRQSNLLAQVITYGYMSEITVQQDNHIWLQVHNTSNGVNLLMATDHTVHEHLINIKVDLVNVKVLKYNIKQLVKSIHGSAHVCIIAHQSKDAKYAQRSSA